MFRTALLAAAALSAVALPAVAQTAGQPTPGEAQARRILERTPLIDGHNDLPWALRQGHGSDPYAVDLTHDLHASTDLHTDIPRLRAGGVGGQFWSVYVPASLTPPDAAVATWSRLTWSVAWSPPIPRCLSWPRPPTTSSASIGVAGSPA